MISLLAGLHSGVRHRKSVFNISGRTAKICSLHWLLFVYIWEEPIIARREDSSLLRVSLLKRCTLARLASFHLIVCIDVVFGVSLLLQVSLTNIFVEVTAPALESIRGIQSYTVVILSVRKLHNPQINSGRIRVYSF